MNFRSRDKRRETMAAAEIPTKTVTGSGLQTLRKWLADSGPALIVGDDTKAQPLVVMPLRMWQWLVKRIELNA
jgi:hypothetical protein